MVKKRLGAKAMRSIGCWALAALIIPVATTALADNGEYIYPFPAPFALPKNTPTDKVVARAYRTPQQICGKATCRLVNFYVISLRGNQWNCYGDGPLAGTELRGLDMQVIVNGKPQTKLTGETEVEFSSPVEIQLLRNKYEMVNGVASDRLHFGFITKTPGAPSRSQSTSTSTRV